MEAITDIVNQQEVGQIVVGWPYSMDGSISKQAEKVKLFTQKLCDRTRVPVELRDERLSTVSARRLMQAVNTKKTRKKIPVKYTRTSATTDTGMVSTETKNMREMYVSG